ncbi:hypothetical protein [Sapientia aquatica]|uniref:Uncharacterized protein n=1 Tax=Sapientia aquatica TaxID=1549640 RepID=A0A4R5W2L0_9BURK|nr:hypothetical protein [Sapientia aquatica]TDK66007.1 hypothetical protein E2I14_10465 [Sapientia aquatica]
MKRMMKRWWLTWRLNSLVRRQENMDALLLAAELETMKLRRLHRDSSQVLGQRRTELRTALIRLA